MQSDDDLQPLFGLIASTVERSQLKKQIQSRENPCAAQSSSEDEGRESSPCSEHSSIPTNELECSEESCEWMFMGPWYFPNTCGLLRGVPQDLQALTEPVSKIADEIKSAFLKMLDVKPEYIVVVTNPPQCIRPGPEAHRYSDHYSVPVAEHEWSYGWSRLRQ